MFTWRWILLFLIFFFAPFGLRAAGISYSVDFEGLDNPDVLKAIKSTVQLTSLKKRPPASINALRYRAESDIPEMLKILRAYGYYEAQINVRVQELNERQHVIVTIFPGPVYKILNYKIDLHTERPQDKMDCSALSLNSIDIEIGKPAIAQKIIESELKILQFLANCGFPLASIEKQQMIANGETKGIYIQLDIKTGPLAHFGKVQIKGETSVSSKLIEQKIDWQKNQLYNSTLVENTQRILLDTGLFSAVVITHEETLCPDGTLPMMIDVTETKHKNINAGLSYQSVYGPGISFGWENRNIGGMGRKLSFQGDATKKSHSGLATYLIPDFHKVGQDYVTQAQALREEIKAKNDIHVYTQRSYSLANRIERKTSRRVRFSVGAKMERLLVKESVDNGTFSLLEIPLYFRWSNANSLLNPTKGTTLEWRVTPTLDIANVNNYYLTQELVQAFYHPIDKNHHFVIAQKISLGSILSPGLGAVPVPKRFLGGSEEELRGYAYRTVSPLKHKRQPIGGRSAIYYSFEPRFRLSQVMGLVPFFDLGNVQEHVIPYFKGKWFKSVGIGFRYFSFLGPLRMDIGFPLDRRKRLDSFYKIFVSVGQMF